MWYKTMQDNGIESPGMMGGERKPPWGSDICVAPVGPEGASMQKPRERVFQPERTTYGKALRLKQPIECEGGKREKERESGRQRVENWFPCVGMILPHGPFGDSTFSHT